MFVREATGLIREFNTFDLLLIATGLIFPLEAAVLEFPYFYGFSPGADLSIALLMAAGPFVVLMLVYWAMGVIMPRAGNDYVWTGRIFGPVVGFVWSVYYTFALLGGGYTLTATAVAYALSTSLSVGGSLYNSPQLTVAGIWLSAPIGEFLLAWAFACMVFLASFFGKATVKFVLYMGWISAILGTIVMWGLLGTTNPSTFAAKWNAAFSHYTAYAAMVSAAGKTGWSPSATTLSATVASVPVAILFLLGGNYVNGVAGEVRNVKRAIPISLFGSLAFSMIFWIITADLTLGAVGGNWLSAVGYLYDNAAAAYTAALPFPPSMPLMLGLISYPNMFLFFIIAFVFVAGSLPGLLFFFWIPTRYFFAWSFDRILPTKMAEVNEHGAPVYSVIAMFALATVYVGLFYFTGFPSALALVTILVLSSYIIPSLGAAVLPYHKQEYFRLAPRFMQNKILKLPVVTIIGILSALSFVYATYLALVNPLLATITKLGATLTVGVVILAVTLYYATVLNNNRKGVDIRLGFKRIPPE